MLAWLVLIKFLQLSVWPLLEDGFGRCAYGAAYPVSLLIFALGSWYAGLLHIPVILALLPFLCACIYNLWRGRYTRDEWLQNISWDAVFLIFFLLLLEVRYLNPTISFAEKFMDHAFLASIIRNPVVPPVDPWFAGGSLNVYYYLGHWMMGALAIVTGIPSTVAFNLILPTVTGLAAVSLYGCGRLLLRRFSWLPILTLLIPNPAFILHLAAGKPATTVLWESTRVIPDTITEYPLFSVLWGDPHAHVISLFTQAFLLFLLILAAMRWHDLADRGRWLLVVCSALGLGSIALINSWDILIYAPVLLLFGMLVWWKEHRLINGDRRAWRLALVTPLLAVGLYLPYFLQLDSQGIGGIGLVTDPSGLIPFLLVFGLFITIFVVECRDDIVSRPVFLLAAVPFVLLGYGAAALAAVPLAYLLLRRRFAPPDLLAAVGLAILVFIEFFYLIDNMGDVYYRMNTVFKFSLVAWMLMGISAFTYIGRWLDSLNPGALLPEHTGRLAAAVGIILLLIIPFIIPDLSFGYGSRTLDGAAYLEEDHPGDAAAIAYLRSLPEETTLVEAEGGDYTYFSRISSFTGIPTLIGMPFHEQMWRGSRGNIGTRMSDVRRIYEDPARTIPLMNHYGIEYLYLGTPERSRYNVSLPSSGLTLIYDVRDVQIYRISA